MKRTLLDTIFKKFDFSIKDVQSYNAGLLQGRAYRVLNDHISRVLEPYNVTIPEWKLLGKLTEQEYLKASDAAQILDVEPPLVTRLVIQLERKKLVKRVDSPDDARERHLTATAKGKALIKKLEPLVKDCLKQLLNGVSLSEMMVYSKVLKTIVHNANS